MSPERRAAIAAMVNANGPEGPRLSPDDTIEDLLAWLRWSNHGTVECDHDPSCYPETTAELWDEIANIF